MSLVYLAYEVCIKDDDRTVIISASSSDKIASSLGKYSEELIHVIENTNPSDLMAKLEREINRDLPQILPDKRTGRIDSQDFRNIRFKLNRESEAQLRESYRNVVSSYIAIKDNKEGKS